MVKLLVQPDDGIQPILDALDHAKHSIRILIFRFDRPEIERSLVAAIERGVTVQALIAYTNQGEEKNLRRLEMRLLERGCMVMRTNDDLVRYHGKMFIIDEKTLYLLAFNFTHLDIDLSRSFGIVTSKHDVVKEALRLFDCDAHRQPYTTAKSDLVVSPVNSREALTNFIRGAKKQILLYEMKISDPDFLKLLNQKTAEGIEVRTLSRASTKNGYIPVRRMPTRMHLRAIIRDGKDAFVGSQSLRKLELEARREIGLFLDDSSVIRQMMSIFEKDWKTSEPALAVESFPSGFRLPARKLARKVARHIAEEGRLEEVLDRVLERHETFEPAEVAQTVREAFRDEVQEAVHEALHDLVVKVAGHA